MTTVTIELSEELALKAANAGLLAPEAIEAILREQLRLRAVEAMWQRAPLEELTPEIEQDIVATVRQVRAEQRAQGTKG
jgi:hypothetical protein